MLDKLFSLANSLSLLILLTAGGAVLMLPWLVALWRQSARTVWIFVVTLSLPFFQYLISWLLNYIVATNLTEIRGFMTPWFDVELSSAVIAALALICLFYACYTGWGVCLIWAVTSKTMVGGTRSLQRVRPAVSALVAFSVVGFLSLGFLASVESIRVIDVVLFLPLMWCLLWAFLLWMITARTTNTTKERYCSFRRTSHIYAGVGLAVTALAVGALALGYWPVAILLFLVAWLIIDGVPGFLKV